MESISFRSMLIMLIYWAKDVSYRQDTEVLLEAGNEVGSEINADETNYGLCSFLVTILYDNNVKK
jgi:hypothetical protein